MDYKGNLWSAVLALAVGIALVFFSNIALHTVVLVVGILFIATGVFNLVSELNRKDEKGRKATSTTGVLSAAGAGVLGILMVCTPGSMVNLMVYLFAAAIILLGLYLIFTMSYSYRPIVFPVWFYILPSLLVICGVVICIVGATTVADVMIMITGIALIVYAVAAFVEIAGLLAFRRDMKKAAKAAAATAEPAVVDVEAKEEPARVEEHKAEEPKASDEKSSTWPADQK